MRLSNFFYDKFREGKLNPMSFHQIWRGSLRAEDTSSDKDFPFPLKKRKGVSKKSEKGAEGK